MSAMFRPKCGREDERWYDKYTEEEAAATPFDELSVKPVTCGHCGWKGNEARLIDHSRIPCLLCPCCLTEIPGTRKTDMPTCPECGSLRLTPDNLACLECDWPEAEIQSEPTTENPEDLP